MWQVLLFMVRLLLKLGLIVKLIANLIMQLSVRLIVWLLAWLVVTLIVRQVILFVVRLIVRLLGYLKALLQHAAWLDGPAAVTEAGAASYIRGLDVSAEVLTAVQVSYPCVTLMHRYVTLISH